MGFKIATDDKGVKIKRKDRTTANGNNFATYSAVISKKLQGGGYGYSGVDLKFKNGTSLNNNAVIKFTDADAWFTFDEFNGRKFLKIFVVNFEVIDAGEETKVQQIENGSNGFLEIPDGIDSELPFV